MVDNLNTISIGVVVHEFGYVAHRLTYWLNDYGTWLYNIQYLRHHDEFEAIANEWWDAYHEPHKPESFWVVLP